MLVIIFIAFDKVSQLLTLPNNDIEPALLLANQLQIPIEKLLFSSHPLLPFLIALTLMVLLLPQSQLVFDPQQWSVCCFLHLGLQLFTLLGIVGIGVVFEVVSATTAVEVIVLERTVDVLGLEGQQAAVRLRGVIVVVILRRVVVRECSDMRGVLSLLFR